MEIKQLIKKFIKSPFRDDVIIALSDTGRHMLASGHTAPVLTDERLHIGDRVITVEDDQGRIFILSGKK